METKPVVAFTEPANEAERQRRIVEIIADGFYAYLKANGHLKKNAGRSQKIEALLEESRRICHAEQYS